MTSSTLLLLAACIGAGTISTADTDTTATGDTGTTETGQTGDTGSTGTPGFGTAIFTLSPCASYGSVDEIAADLEVTVDGTVVYSERVTTCAAVRLEALPAGHVVARASDGDWSETYYVTGTGIYESWGGTDCSGEVEGDLVAGAEQTVIVPLEACAG